MMFEPLELSKQRLLLASHLPIGRVWEQSFSLDSNLGKLIAGLAVEFYRTELLTKEISDELNVNKTLQLLEEWEKSVGIPCDCFDTNKSIEERRKSVLAKLSKFGGVQKAEDFVRVAALFGFNIAVLPGVTVGTFPLEFPAVFFGDTKDVTHTIFIQVLGNLSGDDFFPLGFPLPFSSGGTTFLECIFKSLAPANVEVIVIDESDL